jgi:hypothetical protein
VKTFWQGKRKGFKNICRYEVVRGGKSRRILKIRKDTMREKIDGRQKDE